MASRARPSTPVRHGDPGSGRGRSHGTSGKNPFDRWFRYPAGFASDYVGLLLDQLNIEEGTVADCFAGSAVTGTAARARGLSFVGIEAHPLVAELARTKLDSSTDASEVRSLAKLIADEARIDVVASTARWESETELVRRSFSEPVLRELVTLRTLIKDRIAEPGAVHLKWALLATLRDVAGVKVGWPYQRPGVPRHPKHSDVIRRFEQRVEFMADDIESVVKTPASMEIIVGDSQDPETWASLSKPLSACVTSPPYLNNYDYADATRLELFFWGDVTTWRDMCANVRADMLIATTQQSSVKGKTEALAALTSSDTTTTREIIALVEDITAAKVARNKRSKEYDQVAPAYFVAISRILTNLNANLAPGASALWLVGDSAPYGVYVDTPKLIGNLAEDIGFEFVEDIHLRDRGNRWGSNNDRHKVPLSERLVVMRKPIAN